jgi:hypothetical protein
MGRETEVQFVRKTSKVWDDHAALATLLDSCATRYCAGLTGVQQLRLVVLHDGDKKARHTLPALRTGALQFHAGAPGLATEAPNAVGSLQLAMRHDELIMNQISNVLSTQQAIIAELRKAEQERSAEVRELFLALLSELQKSVKLGHEYRMAELNFQMRWEERRRIGKLVPALVNATTGREIFPAPNEYQALFETLFDAIDEKEITVLNGVLREKSPELSGLFMNALAKHGERKAREAEELVRVSRQTIGVDPEEDAAGMPSAIMRRAANQHDTSPRLVEHAPVVETNGHSKSASNGSANGAAPTSNESVAPRADDGGKLLDDLLAAAGAHVGLLVDSLSEKDPALAARLKERLAKGATSA